MGQKVNPVGLRLGINRTWDSRWYADGDYAELREQDLKLRDGLALLSLSGTWQLFNQQPCSVDGSAQAVGHCQQQQADARYQDHGANCSLEHRNQLCHGRHLHGYVPQKSLVITYSEADSPFRWASWPSQRPSDFSTFSRREENVFISAALRWTPKFSTTHA